MSQTPMLKQILDALEKQVFVGRTYLDTARGLLNADPVLLQTAPTFFGMAIDGGLELAQMTVARLYDTTRNTLSVPRMLKRMWGQPELSDFFHAGPCSKNCAVQAVPFSGGHQPLPSHQLQGSTAKGNSRIDSLE